MKHASLFSGIGGFDQAAEEMGWENLLHCEINSFGQEVLKHHWPKATTYDDIKTADFSVFRNRIDVLTGGFPCQPFSTAGKQLGTEDDRHLWPAMLRAIREISPRWVVGENVRGLIGWNGGLVFEQVQADLEAEGYEVLPFLLPACAVSAPHRRDRIWFVAHRTDARSESMRRSRQDPIHGFEDVADTARFSGNGCSIERASKRKSRGKARSDNSHEFASNTIGLRSAARDEPVGWEERKNPDRGSERTGLENAADTLCTGCEEFNAATLPNKPGFSAGGSVKGWQEDAANPVSRRSQRQQEETGWEIQSDGNAWSQFPTQPPVCAGNDGFPTESLRQRIREDCLGVISEKEIDSILSAAYAQWRNESIKGGGNAIVPQVVLQIFKAIEQYENLQK